MKDVMIVSINKYNRIVSVFLFVMMVFALIPSSYVRSEVSVRHISTLDGLIEFANDINTGKIPSNTDADFIDKALDDVLTLNDRLFSLSDEEIKYNGNQIDENNKPKQQWIPIGTLDRPYRGTFDGKGATISGLYVNDEYGNQGGLFGVLDGATVKNVTIKNSYVRTSNDNGLICGICDNKSTISECNVNSSFCVTDDDDDGKCIGGVCGRCRNSSRIEKCSISGGSVKGKSFIGGIVGDCDTRSEVIDCKSSGINVSGGFGVGGICGKCYDSSKVEKCNIVNGVVNVCVKGQSAIGGIVGDCDTRSEVIDCTSSNINVSGGFGVGGICGDCHNSSKIRGSETSGNISIEFNGELSDGSSDNFSIGGICGKCYDSSKVEKCNIVNGVVNVCVKGQSAIGGIVGESGLKSEITGCSSKETNIDCKERQGEISAPYYIGGICGNAYETTIRNCILSTTDTTKYTISGKYSCIGGICGDACGKSTIINCENQGVELSGDNKSTIGGVCGYLDGAKIEQCYNKGSVDAGEDGDAGGICGASSEEGEILIAECRNEAQITGSCSGGIIGKAGKNTIVEQSYNKGEVQGKENAGGIVGEVCNGTKIKNCYNAGKVTATGEKSAAIAGGLCGKMESGYCSLSYNIGEVFGSISGAACGKCTDSNVLYCYYDKSKLNKVEPGGAVALTSYEMSFSLDVVKKHMIGFDLHSEAELEKGVWYIKECNREENNETYYYPQLSVFRGKESEISLENCVIIKDLNDLQTFRDRVNGWENGSKNGSQEPGLNGLLIADITINDTININDDGSVNGIHSVWTPIGNANNPYTGTFYGNGHTIRGLYIDGSEVEQGLFGVSSGTIKDVKMEGGYVRVKSRSGMICGYNKGGKIIGCSNSGRVVVVKGTNGNGKRSERVGGICGYNDSLNSGEKTTGGLISECCNTGNVLCEGDYSSDIGGICGRNERSDSTIRRCYNTGEIDGSKGGWDVGGICGSNYSENNKISCCYNTGTVIGTKNSTGGIVSWCHGFTENCYNAGTIKGECLQDTGSFIGGICGYKRNNPIKCCYNVGKISAVNLTNGEIGEICESSDISGAISENCYYNSENNNGVKYTGAIPLTTREMTGIGVGRAPEFMGALNGDNWCFFADNEENQMNIGFYPHLRCFSTDPQSVVLGNHQNYMIIKNENDLRDFRDRVNAGETGLDGMLVADIDFGGSYTVNASGDPLQASDSNWEPIGTETKPYTGTFYGNGHTIKGLYIKNDSGVGQGLFGASSGTIENINMEGGYVRASNKFGMICGHNHGGVITNCSVSGCVVGVGGSQQIGGICGLNDNNGKIFDCSNKRMDGKTDEIKILSSGCLIGGICGQNDAIVMWCYNTGKIDGSKGSSNIGGICGSGKNNSQISCCYNTGTVIGVNDSTGGIVSYSYGSIENCYNIGIVINNSGHGESEHLGGVCGCKYGESIKCCYNAGEISAKNNISKGEICGAYKENVKSENCYYNSEINNGTYEDGAVPLTIREMTGIGYGRSNDTMSALPANFWVFKTDEKTENSINYYYPHLRWFSTEPQEVIGCMEIRDQNDLETFRDRVNGLSVYSAEPWLNGILVGDIDFGGSYTLGTSGDPQDSDGISVQKSNWEPIGTDDNPYTGTFYGNGYTITGLCINNDSGVNQGLFGVSRGTIKNVKMSGGYVRAKEKVGMICGHNVGGIIENCSVSGYVVGATDSQQIGGICGQNDAIITRCYNTVAIDGSKGGSSIGGICGSGATDSKVSLCYNTGSVTGVSGGTGGIIGTSAGKTENCYNTGKIGGSGNVGGICGNISGQTGSLDYCYNVGVIEAKGADTEVTTIGAICGSSGNLLNCYYNSDTSMKADKNGTALTTREMTGVGASRSSEKMSSLPNDYWTFNVDSPTDQHIMYYPHLRCFNTTPQSAAHFIEISDKSQLEDFRDRVNKGEPWLNGILVNDIKLNDSIKMKYDGSSVVLEFLGSRSEWEPIGTRDNPYTGTFYGNGHRITGLYIGDTIRDNQGLFGVNKGAIKNVIMAEGGIIARNTFGMICGYNNGGTIENCSVSGYVAGVNGSKQMGGICGFNDANGRISDCSYEDKDGDSSRILLRKSSELIGGICGQNNAIITRCYNTVTVDGISQGGVNMGGICGSGSAGSEVSLCYNTGLVTGTSGGTGGIIGDSAGKTENCYNTGKISGSGNVGGICGNISGQTGSLNCCYNVGVIEGKGSESKLGEICGSSIESVSNCYYNVDVGNGIPDEKSVALTFNGITGVGKNRANEKMHALSADFWVFVPDSEKDNIITKYYPHLRCFNTNQQSQDSDKCVKIYDEVDLTLFRNGINSGNIKSTNALLMSNIMLTQEWDTMIGENKSYDGNFDGNGYIISNLTGKSLFDALGERGVIRNVGVVDGNITNDGSGMLCKTNNGTIECCYSTGEIRGGNVGGICGTNNGTIQNCYSTVDIYGNGVCGGICGTNSKIIQYCFSGGSADPGNRDAKPIVGSGSNGSNCYYNSDVWAGIEGIEIPCTTEAMTGENVADTMSNLDFCSETNPEGKWYCTANYQSSVQDLEMKYYPHLVVFKGNSDPICANVMYISSYTELKKFSDKVNVGHKYMCGVLVKDIDASGDDWTPIGKSTSEYNGRFYGTGKTISKLTYTGTDCAGLFGYCASPSISDVTLSGCTITAKDTAEGTVGHAGGICGGSSSNLTVSNVTLSGCTITAKDTAGGICGDSSSDLIVSNVTLSGCTITAEDTAGHAGGICGSCVSLSASDIVLLSNNIKTNVISVGNDGGFAGGICGKCTTNITMNRCENKDGSVEAGTAGGFCGEFSCYNDGTVNIEWCSNLSKVNGQQYAGGICGNLNGKSFQEVCTNFYIRFCYNEGNITVESSKEIIYIGGLLGRNGDFKNHSIIFGSEVTECYNRGIVSGPATATVNAGGICGMSGGTIKNCYNTGNITGTVTGTVTDSENSANVGGICGVCACEISSTYNIGIVYGKLGVKKSNCVGAICGECEVSPDFLTSYYEDDIGIIGAGGKSNEDVSKSCSLLVMTGLGKGRSSDVMSEWLSDCKWVFTSDIINDSKTGVRTLYYPHLRAFSTEPPSAKTVLISDFATLSNFHTAVSPDSKVFGYMIKDVNVASDFKIEKFDGRFYGNGHKITGLQNGLFTEVSGAIIQGLKLEVNVNVTDKVNTGALVGDAENSFIHRCEIIGDASRVQNASTENVCTGGIVGSMKGGEISVSCNKVTVVGNGSEVNSVGGIVGKAEDGAVIVDTYNWGNVTGSASGFTGGIFGTLQRSYVGTSYNRGEISEGTVGGIGGKIEDTNNMVEYCYYLISKAAKGVGESVSENFKQPEQLDTDGITGTTDGNSRAIDKMVGFGFLLKNPRGVWYAIDDCDGEKTSPQFDVVEDSELIKIYTEEDLDEFIEKANEKPSTSAIVMTAIYCTTPKKPIKGEYQGEFYGASKSMKIFGLQINSPESDDVGLFECIAKDGSVKNIGLVACQVVGKDNVGSIAGKNYGAIQYCYLENFLDYDEWDCKAVAKGVIPYRRVEVDVNGASHKYYVQDMSIWNNFDHRERGESKVSGQNNVGGIVGCNYGEVSYCYNKSKVRGTGSNTGGFVGANYGSISDCYNVGRVRGNSYVGGFVGINAENTEKTKTGNISNSYSACGVLGESDVHGFCGQNTSPDSISGCYFNSDIFTSDLSDMMGLTTDQMTRVPTDGENKDMGSLLSKYWIFESKINEMQYYPHIRGIEFTNSPMKMSGDSGDSSASKEIIVNVKVDGNAYEGDENFIFYVCLCNEESEEDASYCNYSFVWNAKNPPELVLGDSLKKVKEILLASINWRYDVGGNSFDLENGTLTINLTTKNNNWLSGEDMSNENDLVIESSMM